MVMEPLFPINCIVLGVLCMLFRILMFQKMLHVDWLSSNIMRQRSLVGWAWVLNEKEYCAAHTLSLPDYSYVLSFMLENWTDFFFERVFFSDLFSTILLSFSFVSSLSMIGSVHSGSMCNFLPQLWQTAFFFHSTVLCAALEFPSWENATTENSRSFVNVV